MFINLSCHIRIRQRVVQLILLSLLIVAATLYTYNETYSTYPDFFKSISLQQFQRRRKLPLGQDYLLRLGARTDFRSSSSPPSSSSPDIKITDYAKYQALNNVSPDFNNKGKRPKACFVSLVRNSELEGMLQSIKLIQKRFNNQYNYPWVFLNDKEFTQEFKTAIKDELSPNVEVKFGLIPETQWSFPDFINKQVAENRRTKLMKNVPYGTSASYRFMCRYQAGFFWRHPLLADYDWYWRVEPNTEILCDLPYDVFQWMQDNRKVYGFVISIVEFPATIPSLWSTAMEFFHEHPEYVSPDNSMGFISTDGIMYNNCHFWSNFEIGNLNFWRSKAYREYFEYLDRAGGFFYERWGDAPVHTIALAAMLPRDSIHYFQDIGYYHQPRYNCPLDDELYSSRHCSCPQDKDITFRVGSCGNRWYEFMNLKKPAKWKGIFQHEMDVIEGLKDETQRHQQKLEEGEEIDDMDTSEESEEDKEERFVLNYLLGKYVPGVNTAG